MADVMVKRVQEWLNTTYGNNNDFIPVDEDGITGRSTVKALIRAIQIELDVTVDGALGEETLAILPTLSRNTDTSDLTYKNLVYILQGAMYCKGYNPNGLDGLYGDGVERAINEFKNDAGFEGDGITTPKFFKALLNTDGFKLDTTKGDVSIRVIQQELNKKYSEFFDLIPTTGIYEKFTNKGLIKALQVEQGTTPDGVFGANTLNNCPVLRRYGSVTNKNFVYILQYALYCNRCDPNGFDGGFGAGVESAVKKFQEFVGMQPDGVVGKDTWASLMISCGNRERKGKGCDTAYPITDYFAKALVADGREYVGRYIGGGSWKRLTAEELEIIFANGLKVFPIYQTVGDHLEYFSSAQGTSDAFTAINNAKKLGFPIGTTIYFAVDFDAVDNEVTTNILPYFKAIHSYFNRILNLNKGYFIGVYGPRNICSRVTEAGYAVSSFVSDMSTGYSGNLGYLLPETWAFDQISTVNVYYGPQKFTIDNLITSKRAWGVAKVDSVGKYLGMKLPNYLNYVDKNVMTAKEQHISLATEAILGKLYPEPSEEMETFMRSLLELQESLRIKEQNRYIYDEFMDETGNFTFNLPDQDIPEEERYEFLLQEYRVYTATDIQEMRRSDEATISLAGFIPVIGTALGTIAQMVYDDTYGEHWVTVDNLTGVATGTALDFICKKYDLTEKTQMWLSGLITSVDTYDAVQRPPEETDNVYIVEYIPHVGGGGEDYGDTKFVIRPGDVYLNFQTKKDGVYVGNYIVYLSKHDKVTDENEDELKAQIVWFYSI